MLGEMVWWYTTAAAAKVQIIMKKRSFLSFLKEDACWPHWSTTSLLDEWLSIVIHHTDDDWLWWSIQTVIQSGSVCCCQKDNLRITPVKTLVNPKLWLCETTNKQNPYTSDAFDKNTQTLADTKIILSHGLSQIHQQTIQSSLHLRLGHQSKDTALSSTVTWYSLDITTASADNYTANSYLYHSKCQLVLKLHVHVSLRDQGTEESSSWWARW